MRRPDLTRRPRVVVVGHGMAGARFVQELRARDPERRWEVVAFGEEADAAYNRVLLSSVLAGSLRPQDVQLIPSAWYAAEEVEVRTGVAVATIDRRRRRVLTTAGEHVAYDHLVLATGSAPWLPPVEDLVTDDGELADGVSVFRTLDDCRRLLGRLPRIQRAAVLGGGLLGLEAARGLAGHGIEVQVVHPADRLMERQLDADAGRLLARTLRALGVQVRLGVPARRFDSWPQRVLVLDDGSRVPAELLVVACGVRPRVGLARDARLAVERAVVVDDTLTSVTDPRVHAIGECAQHDGQVYGLVAPAWEQAAVLANALTGGDARYRGSRVVTRLKAADVDLAAMGETAVDDFDDAAEVLRFADPARGTYQKLVIRQGSVAGAIMVGAPTVGAVTQLFDRQGPVPADRRTLLFPGVVGTVDAAGDPARLDDGHLVCRCNAVSAGTIRSACRDGARSAADVARRTRATTGCGGCRDTVRALVDIEIDTHREEVAT